MKNSLARLVLLLSTVCLLTSAWGDCPNGLPTSKFGYWVKVGAGAGVGGDGPHPMKEETCWVAGRGATMQDHAESHNQWTDFASEYSYTVAPPASAPQSGSTDNSPAAYTAVVTHMPISG